MDFTELLGYEIPLWAVLAVNAVYFVFMSAVNSLEAPDEKSSASYRFWFKFLNRIAANLSRARVFKNGNGNGAA